MKRKFKKGERIVFVSSDEPSYWTCDGYDMYGKIFLKEQKWTIDVGGKIRPTYHEKDFRKATKLEKALK